jgi:hypothetical protein
MYASLTPEQVIDLGTFIAGIVVEMRAHAAVWASLEARLADYSDYADGLILEKASLERQLAEARENLAACDVTIPSMVKANKKLRDENAAMREALAEALWLFDNEGGYVTPSYQKRTEWDRRYKTWRKAAGDSLNNGKPYSAEAGDLSVKGRIDPRLDRDEEWCRVLVAMLDPRRMNRVLAYFNDNRSDKGAKPLEAPIEREVINPHDSIFIGYADPEAAQVAVMVAGNGAYGIEGDGGMPLFLIDGVAGMERWVGERYGTTLTDWIRRMDRKRLVVALRSMRLPGERSSMSAPVSHAHALADQIELAGRFSAEPVASETIRP